ncbi:hypothetical protein ACMGD3_12530 [Lysinibacillus sphaericus]
MVVEPIGLLRAIVRQSSFTRCFLSTWGGWWLTDLTAGYSETSFSGWFAPLLVVEPIGLLRAIVRQSSFTRCFLST